MNRRSITVLLTGIVALLIGMALLLHDKSGIFNSYSSSPAVGQQGNEPSDSNVPEQAAENSVRDSGNVDTVETLRNEEVTVYGNSPEYDLKVFLCKDGRGEEFLKFEYYNEGASSVKELGKSEVAELEDIFDKRNAAAGEKNGYKVRGAYLNAKYSKVYLWIEGRVNEAYADTSIYVVNLKDFKPVKLFSDVGRYTGPLFPKSHKYMAFSYFDSPASSTFQENSVFQLIECETDKFIVKGSRTSEGEYIGQLDDSRSFYDFELISWHSDNTVRLKQTRWSKDASGEEKGSIKQAEVLYNVGKNLIINGDTGTDGDKAEKPTAEKPSKQENEASAPESEAVKTLKSFYSYLASEDDYNKALGLLSEDFVLELGILKQFGIEQLSKDDIKAEDASIYAGILKMAKIEEIVREEASDNGMVTVYYYQVFSSEEGSQGRAFIAARLGKVDGKCQIKDAKEIAEGNGQENEQKPDQQPNQQ